MPALGDDPQPRFGPGDRITTTLSQPMPLLLNSNGKRRSDRLVLGGERHHFFARRSFRAALLFCAQFRCVSFLCLPYPAGFCFPLPHALPKSRARSFCS
jgi:hypothetical protein